MFKLAPHENLTDLNIENIEKHYSAKYVGDFPVSKDATKTAAVFYRAELKEPYTNNYFGIFWGDNKIYICDMDWIKDIDILGIASEDGTVVYSRNRWDCRWLPDESAAIDGGTSYSRILGKPFKKVGLSIKEGELVIND